MLEPPPKPVEDATLNTVSGNFARTVLCVNMHADRRRQRKTRSNNTNFRVACDAPRGALLFIMLLFVFRFDFSDFPPPAREGCEPLALSSFLESGVLNCVSELHM
eukprot:3138017-Rhodomonas_salina.1